MKYVAAIDVGGTKILGALVNEEGTVKKEIRVPSDFALGGLHVMEKIFGLIDQFVQIEKIDAIGIGIGGRIDTEKGIINWGVKPVPHWFGLNVRKMTEDRYHIPCAVDNDVKVAGYGEQWKGAAKGLDSYVCITLGTGIGAAVCIDGKMLHGKHWSGGEIGHSILYPGGRLCTCGFRGCTEQYLCGTALVKIYNEKSCSKVSNGYEFFERVKDKDELAESVLEQFVEDLSTLMNSLCNTYDPEKFIIGGGLIDTKEFWWDKFQKKMSISPINQVYAPEIVPALLGNKAGYYGAAYIAFEYLKKEKLNRSR